MRRTGPAFLSALCLLAIAVSAVGAQAPSAGAMQTVRGSDGGYQIQVPANWQAQPFTFQEQFGAPSGGQMQTASMRLDVAYASVDGTQRLVVGAVNGAQVPAASLPSVLQAAVGAVFASTQTALQAAGGSAMNIFTGPAAVTVPNADAAAGGIASYTDPNGVGRVVAVRGAIHAQTAYLLTLDVTQDFYTSDPDFNAILGSFQLTP